MDDPYPLPLTLRRGDGSVDGRGAVMMLRCGLRNCERRGFVQGCYGYYGSVGVGVMAGRAWGYWGMFQRAVDMKATGDIEREAKE